MHVHASTSYFKMVKHGLLYTSGVWSNFTSFDAENIQQFREAAIHSSMKFVCLFRFSHLELSQMYVFFISVSLSYMYVVSTYIN